MEEQPDTLGLAGRIGGDLCLDYVNTVDWHSSDHPVEYLREYGDLVRWAQHGGLLASEQAAQVLAVATAAPQQAQQALDAACALREALYRLFRAATTHTAAAAADLAHLNTGLGHALAHACLLPTAEGFAWGWQEPAGRLAAPLWPVLRSAADLLTGPQLGRVRQCADGNCGWFFLDTSKNHSRRWCSMEGCGSRAKAREYYQRKRAAR
ncbi:MAG: ABATE domain-containing protein [Chloroflexota bacterium]|nr:ABATE domain-containing protein [Chloroflexota bacterium]